MRTLSEFLKCSVSSACVYVGNQYLPSICSRYVSNFGNAWFLLLPVFNSPTPFPYAFTICVVVPRLAEFGLFGREFLDNFSWIDLFGGKNRQTHSRCGGPDKHYTHISLTRETNSLAQ